MMLKVKHLPKYFYSGYVRVDAINYKENMETEDFLYENPNVS